MIERSRLKIYLSNINMSKISEVKFLSGKLCKILGSTISRPFPYLFTFPGLRSIPFFNKSDFPWSVHLEENLKTIQGEYENAKKVYKTNDYQGKDDKEHILNYGDLHWFGYILNGQKRPEFEQLCPKTTKILSQVEGLMTDIPFSYSYFSTLYPESSIQKHTGPSNIKLRCHFPIFAPEGAFIRVAGSPTNWEDGKLMIFDESFEHEENNTENELSRAVLVFDIWHPDLHLEEREALVTAFLKAKTQDQEGI